MGLLRATGRRAAGSAPATTAPLSYGSFVVPQTETTATFAVTDLVKSWQTGPNNGMVLLATGTSENADATWCQPLRHHQAGARHQLSLRVQQRLLG